MVSRRGCRRPARPGEFEEIPLGSTVYEHVLQAQQPCREDDHNDTLWGSRSQPSQLPANIENPAARGRSAVPLLVPARPGELGNPT